MGAKSLELELVEEYVYGGKRRFRFKLKGTNFIVNVSAESMEDGVRRAIEVLKKLGVITEVSGAAGI